MVRSVGAYGMDTFGMLARMRAAKARAQAETETGRTATPSVAAAASATAGSVAESQEDEDKKIGSEIDETDDNGDTGVVDQGSGTEESDETDETDETEESGNEEESDESSKKTERSKSLLLQTVEEMQAAGYTKISWTSLEEYRQGMEKEFMSDFRAALRELGVDENIEFNLVAGADGTVSVVTKHADKAKIEQYLANNPDVAEEFLKIQALADYQRGARRLNVAEQLGSIADLRSTFQSQALTSFFNANDSTSQIMSFTGDTAMINRYLTGLNLTV